MKILADENIEREFIEALREADFDVFRRTKAKSPG